ncbi:MAG: methyltransferase domain-containing protein [Rhodospirillales bacterium]|nr:methyltransferase domain-containing protein [Rhodospirillales bacterium]
MPSLFDDWQELRVDVDPASQPDLLSSITDLSAIPNGIANAVWSSHCLEHLYAHQVGQALQEFWRILADDGFVCIIVPDLQAVASYVAADQLHQVVYQSPVGPITAHDMLFGFGAAVAQGHTSMAHKCGFTPSAMVQCLSGPPFGEVIVRRRPTLELAAVCTKKHALTEAQREALLSALEL